MIYTTYDNCPCCGGPVPHTVFHLLGGVVISPTQVVLNHMAQVTISTVATHTLFHMAQVTISTSSQHVLNHLAQTTISGVATRSLNHQAQVTIS